MSSYPAIQEIAPSDARLAAPKPELSIVMINYKTRELTVKCIESIYEYRPRIPFEIILLDNGSDDHIEEKILKRFSHVRFIETGYNLGYAKANNLGISNAHGDYILLLNNDTRLIESNLDDLVSHMKAHPEVGILGPRQIDGMGEFQLSCGKFPTLISEFIRKLIHRRLSLNDYRLRDYLDGKYSNGSVVDWVSGSCMMIRRETLEQVGLLDERFFMYFEDIDICHRAKHYGWGVAYLADRSLIHYGGASVKKNLLSVMVENRRSQLYFSRKYYGALGGLALRLLLLLKYGLPLVKWGWVYFCRRILRRETREPYTMLLLSKKVIQVALSRVTVRAQVPTLSHHATPNDEPQGRMKALENVYPFA